VPRVRIKDNWKAVLTEANKRVEEKLELSALLVERAAKEFCPVRTGTARRSITSNWYGGPGSRTVGWSANKKKGIKAGKTTISAPVKKKAIIGSNIEYFRYIELGTRFMSASAPLRRALEASWGRIKKIFGARR